MSLSSTVTSTFVDIATYDDLEAWFYGLGTQNEAENDLFTVSLFQRKYTRYAWFAQCPSPLNFSGTPAWKANWTMTVPRNADHTTYVWFEFIVSSVTPKAGYTVRWCKNLAHHAYESIQYLSGNIEVQTLTPEYMDMLAAFTVTEDHYVGYANMIGNIDELTLPRGNAAWARFSGSLPQYKLILPVPYTFGEDHGSAFPAAQLVYGEGSFKIKTRDWSDLLIVEGLSSNSKIERIAINSSNYTTYIEGNPPTFTDFNAVANAIIVTRPERTILGSQARTFVITQSQTLTNTVSLTGATVNNTIVAPMNFSHAVSVLFFALRNITFPQERANYTTSSPKITGGVWEDVHSGTSDPFKTWALKYDSTYRLPQGSDIRYYSLIQPYHHAPRIPKEIGYHMYSFALKIKHVDPLGSVNFGKIQTTDASFTLSQACVDAIESTEEPQKFDYVACARNYNVFTVDSGVPGFPVY